ncbi:MAG: ribonuclease HII [Trueperaceae bacterium]
MPPDLRLERALRLRGCLTVAGVDEAGRGAWAGPVVAAVVVLPDLPGLPYVDSKMVSAVRRERLAEHVRATATAWAVAEATVAEVDEMGPLRATHVAVHRAIAVLGVAPDAYVTDYLRLRFATLPQPEIMAPARAEGLSLSVAAASLLAKTHRDARMRAAAVDWPTYGFERHMGYGVPAHRAALRHTGPCPWHRRSVRPVAEIAAVSCLPRPDAKEGTA